MVLILWLEEADKKLAIAKHLISHEFLEDACFFAHQAAEFALNALAEHFRKRYKLRPTIRRYVLEENLKKFSEIVNINEVLKDAQYLDCIQDAYYPHHLISGENEKKVITMYEADKATEAAEKIIDWVRKIVIEEM